MTPTARKLADMIAAEYDLETTFTLPPRTVAIVLIGAGWHGASQVIRELVALGVVVITGQSLRGNLVYRRAVAPFVAVRDPPGEMFFGRAGTSRRDKAEHVLAYLTRYQGRAVGDEFELRVVTIRSDTHIDGTTVANAISDLVANRVLRITVAPSGRIRSGGGRTTPRYVLLRDTVPETFTPTRPTRLRHQREWRRDMFLIPHESGNGAAESFADSNE